MQTPGFGPVGKPPSVIALDHVNGGERVHGHSAYQIQDYRLSGTAQTNLRRVGITRYPAVRA
jgi:hypothetical protein